jgi:hypothetical protein
LIIINLSNKGKYSCGKDTLCGLGWLLIKDQIYGYKYGLKNFYYCNTPDGDGAEEKDMGCESGACAI